jgi:hypothetical protein
MSNCEEYMWLHERYAHALTIWLRTTNSPDIADDKAEEQERDATFRALSDHTRYCGHCLRGTAQIAGSGTLRRQNQ